MRLPPPLAPLLLLAPSVAAQGTGVVSGQFVGPTGVGVAGANLDFFFASTGNAQNNVSNDGTGVGGIFNAVVPGGTYNVLFWPPTSTSLLPKWVNGVAVVAGLTTNLGVVQAAAGSLVSATFLRPGGITPVLGGHFHAVDAATGQEMLVQDPVTNASGQVEAVVPPGTYDFRLDPTLVLGPFLAPWQSLGVPVAGTTSLGTITLLPGFLVSATILGNGAPVADVDADVFPTAGGLKLYTPGDNSDGAGFVDFVVPAGTVDVRFDAPLADGLVTILVPGVVVAGTTSLGTLAMPPGFYLSGVVTAVFGGPLAGVDVDVRDAATNALLPTTGDDTNAAGAYVVVVPAGTWNVRFTPIGAPGYQSVLATGIPVAADTALDASLPTTACSPSAYGAPTPGSGGVAPALAANNPAFPGNPWFALQVSGGLGGMPGLVAIGLGPASLPLLGGTLLVSPVPSFLTLPVVLSGPVGSPGAGQAALPIPLPPSPVLVGGVVFLQEANLDPLAPQGIAFSNGLSVPVCL
ncbi:MAG TPA: carboxypeptidase-like regulatory domain-containing protein [Planctomycetota bacterium]|jgi:hypothetical protein|nr:carboxypeptidase-like regulatory domain-containing protein [Planctomycetota bacterium]